MRISHELRRSQPPHPALHIPAAVVPIPTSYALKTSDHPYGSNREKNQKTAVKKMYRAVGARSLVATKVPL